MALGSVAEASLLGQLATPAAVFADGGGLTPRTLPLPAKAITHIFFSAHSASSAVNRFSDIRDGVTIVVTIVVTVVTVVTVVSVVTTGWYEP